MKFRISPQEIFSEPTLRTDTELRERKRKLTWIRALLVPDELTCGFGQLTVYSRKTAKMDTFWMVFQEPFRRQRVWHAALGKHGSEKVDFAINVEVPDENIVNRMVRTAEPA